jgi:thioredoxin-like negative regulator of GroEL
MLDRLAEQHAGRLKVVRVNVDGAPALASRFGAMSIPTLVVLRDEREVDRVVGALPGDQLARRLESHLELRRT